MDKSTFELVDEILHNSGIQYRFNGDTGVFFGFNLVRQMENYPTPILPLFRRDVVVGNFEIRLLNPY